MRTKKALLTLFSIIALTTLSSCGYLEEHPNLSPIDPKYQPSSADDARHDLYDPNAFEWWYFDADFSNGYSLVTSWHTGNLQIIGGIMARYNFILFSIYDPSGRKVSSLALYNENQVTIGRSSCDVQMGSNRVYGDYPQYQISFRGNEILSTVEVGADLTFTNVTQGFRVPPDGVTYFNRTPEQYLGWVVAQPRASVTGKLIINGQEILVSGEGYHDHNWGNVAITDLYNYWYWGRMFLPGYTLVYSAGQMSDALGAKPTGGMVTIKGQKVVEVPAEITAEASGYQTDPATGQQYPTNVTLKLTNPNVNGLVIMNLQKLIEDMPQYNPKHPQQSGVYFRFLSDCKVDLEVDNQKVQNNSVIIHEYLRP